MKIALYNLTTTTKQGGIETFNWGMAKHLAKRGHIVHIYGGNGNVREEIPEGVSIFTYPFLPRNIIPDFGSRFKKFMERLSFGLFSFKPLTKGYYNLIYIHKPYDLPVALLSSRISGARIVFGSQGTEFFPGYKYMAKKVDYFFSCSSFNAGQIEEYCGIRPLVLPNGINTELFKPASPDSELRNRLQVSDTAHVIVSACRLVGWKGIRYSIMAIAKLIRKGHPIKYLIIGDGEERKNLESLAKKLKIENNIMFLGSAKNSELPKYYSISHIAVFPSIANETFGISIAEAMACGIPVISINVGGIPEVVAEKGFLVPPRDENAIADKIELLISDEEMRKNMGIAGRKWIVDNFSWDIIADRFERYLDNA